MSLPMPPCFDCGTKLERRNVRNATKQEMESNPDYDFCNGKDGSGIVSLCDGCDIKREKNEMLKNEIEKHENFNKEIKDYIKDCLKNKVSPNAILESFSKIIDQTVNEAIAEATHS